MQCCRFASMFLLACLCAAAATVPAAGANDEFEIVTMSYVGGEACVELDKPTATIYRNKNPRKVQWTVTAGGRFWEIRYQESSPDPEKPDGQGDYFLNSGRLDIRCSQMDVRTVVPDRHVPEKARWPYLIRVYECDQMQMGDLLCELDPNVDWGD